MSVVLISRAPKPWDWCLGKSERMKKWEYRRIRLRWLREQKQNIRKIMAGIVRIPIRS